MSSFKPLTEIDSNNDDVNTAQKRVPLRILSRNRFSKTGSKQNDDLKVIFSKTNPNFESDKSDNQVQPVDDPAVINKTEQKQPFVYGSIEHVLSFKKLYNAKDKRLPKKVREFYETQDEFIDSLEDIVKDKNSDELKSASTKTENKARMIKILTIVTLIVNIILVIIKIAAAVISKSLSVISSVVDSVVDLLTSVILIYTQHKINRADNSLYPAGRTRLEPIAIIILSVIMCSASVEVIFESAETLAGDVKYFETNSTTLQDMNMSAMPITAMVLTIVSKAILFVLCYRVKNPTMYALAEDHRNDVASNIVALGCGLIASFALKHKIKEQLVVLDPVGAIVISVYIIIAWILQANRQVRHLSGLVAEHAFVQRLIYYIYNTSPNITKIDSVNAYHFGTGYLAEVDVVLPPDMELQEAHDIGAELQIRLEKIDEVDRAYVHLDYNTTHYPAIEHKVLTKTDEKEIIDG